MNQDDNGMTKLGCVNHDCDKCKARQQEPVRVPVTDNTYNYAKSLAEAIFKQHFASDEHYSSGRIVWGVNDTVIGILTQIDNMVADMVRRPAQQQEPVAYRSRLKSGSYTYCNTAQFFDNAEPLYTSPPASKPWVGLTDEEREHIWNTVGNSDAHGDVDGWSGRYVMATIEAKLRERNT